jgi:hypothetical protein
MKKTILFFAALLTLLSISSALAQVNYSGWWQSNLYLWENPDDAQYYSFYQGLQFRISPQNYSNLYLNTYFRVAYRDDLDEMQEKVHNLYLNWNLADNYRLRIGRQFIYQGVINGTMDAFSLSGRFVKNLQLHAVIGTEAPYTREFDLVEWDSASVMGVYASYKLPWSNSLEVSYFQKQRQSELYWQQLGTALLGTFQQKINYYLRMDYNLLAETYQTLRGRLSYLANRWALTAEYNSQRPRIYEDSFFNIFVVNPYNQLRLAGNYRMNEYEFGLQLLHTVYNVHEFYILFKDDNDLRLVGSIGHQKFGTLGLVLQNGDAGDNLGYFADIRYEFLPNITARLYNSYFKYERTSTNISEDALAFLVGLGYRYKKVLLLEGELQQSSNNIYKNDTRGLVKLTFLFGN